MNKNKPYCMDTDFLQAIGEVAEKTGFLISDMHMELITLKGDDLPRNTGSVIVCFSPKVTDKEAG